MAASIGERDECPESREHRQRHPLGRVPVLELDNGQHIFESAAICLHLGDLHPESGLVPPIGTTDRALVYQWTVFAMAEVEPSIFGWLRARRAEQDETEHAARFAPIASTLRDALSDPAWLIGETFTVADVLCSSMLGTAFRRDLISESGALRSYVERAAQRPANLRAEAIRG